MHHRYSLCSKPLSFTQKPPLTLWESLSTDVSQASETTKCCFSRVFTPTAPWMYFSRPLHTIHLGEHLDNHSPVCSSREIIIWRTRIWASFNFHLQYIPKFQKERASYRSKKKKSNWYLLGSYYCVSDTSIWIASFDLYSNPMRLI